MIWISEAPNLRGARCAWYWYRPTPGSNIDMRPIMIREDGHYVEDGEIRHPALFAGGEWSDCPIPLPKTRGIAYD